MRSTLRRVSLPLLATLLFLPSPAVGQAGQTPCSGEEHRRFDFWLGQWDVFRPDGSQAGQNSITLKMDGCVVHESYRTPGGYHGESFNVFDASRGVWHQSWVDSSGLLLLLEGAFSDGAMVLRGETVGADGSRTLHRITWTVAGGDPDRVRQLWESSTDGGRSWTVAFDGEYRRAGT